MKLCVLCVVFIVFAALQSFAGTGDAVLPEGQLPNIKKDCSICHVSHGADGKVALKKPLSELCLECHPDRKAPSDHAVDIIPLMEVRKLPLKEGKITCITCHDPHSNPYGKILRMRTDSLCIVCHNKRL